MNFVEFFLLVVPLCIPNRPKDEGNIFPVRLRPPTLEKYSILMNKYAYFILFVVDCPLSMYETFVTIHSGSNGTLEEEDGYLLLVSMSTSFVSELIADRLRITTRVWGSLLFSLLATVSVYTPEFGARRLMTTVMSATSTVLTICLAKSINNPMRLVWMGLLMALQMIGIRLNYWLRDTIIPEILNSIEMYYVTISFVVRVMAILFTGITTYAFRDTFAKLLKNAEEQIKMSQLENQKRQRPRTRVHYRKKRGKPGRILRRRNGNNGSSAPTGLVGDPMNEKGSSSASDGNPMLNSEMGRGSGAPTSN